MKSISNHADQIGIAPLCQALGVSRATYYRSLNPAPVPKGSTPRPLFNNALSESERQTVLQILHSGRFVDQAPATVYATLLDEGNYFCSTRTMYRILNSQQEVRERRRQTSHPKYVKPQLKATAPNQVWSWDITKLPGPAKWSHFSLYVVLDIYSRYVVGWMLAEHEKASLAEDLLKESCRKQAIVDGQLTIHADRGTSMTSKQVALLLSDLGVTKTHSRPHVSNDNPFSESQFKTMNLNPAVRGWRAHFVEV
jgi:putative transposase